MNILIVEDELVIARSLQHVLRGFGYQANEIAVNFDQAAKVLDTQPIDLALLDISLHGNKTGIDVAEYIVQKFNIPFIFLTSQEDLRVVDEALSMLPYSFLNKPFEKIAVYSAVKLALDNFQQKQQTNTKPDSAVFQDSLFIKEKQAYSKILLSDLLYIQSDDNYLELYTDHKKYIIRETLKKIILQLPADSFMRIHKSFIINIERISSISNNSVNISGNEIPLSPDNRAELLGKLKTFS